MQTFYRAGFATSSAADTFRGMRYLISRKIYRAYLLAGLTGDAAFLFPADLYQTETVKESIDGAQRAEILAEGAVDFYGQQKEYK